MAHNLKKDNVMIILYGAPGSVFVRKPRILLQEKNIEFKSDPINLYQYVNDKFKEASPLNKIPALSDGDFTLADSSAICAYLDKKYPYPSFYPTDPEEYGKALWYEEYADTALFQAIAPCYYQTILVPLYQGLKPDQAAIDLALNEKLPKVASYLENQLIKKEYLVGNQFTIADVSLVSIFLNMYLSGYKLNHKTWPHLSNYLENHFQRESFVSCRKDIEAEKLRMDVTNVA